MFKKEKTLLELLQIAGIKDAETTLANHLLDEAVNSASYAVDDASMTEFLSRKFVGMRMWAVVGPNSFVIDSVTHSTLDNNNFVFAAKDISSTNHPVGSSMILDYVKKALPKRSKVSWETPSRQNPKSMTLTIYIPPTLPNDYVGGILQFVKDKTPILLTIKANEKLKNAVQIVNKHIFANSTNIIECQEELFKNDLDEFAKLK